MKNAPWSRLGADRLPIAEDASWQERLDRSSEKLVKSLSTGRTVVFCGNGCSTPLGYPRWPALVDKLAAAALRALPEEDSELESLVKKARKQANPERLMASVTICKRALHKATGSNAAYLELLRKEFLSSSPGRRLKAAENRFNPYLAILDLPVHRFVTTNYDLELERALYRRRDVVFPEFGLGSLKSMKRGPVTGASFTHESVKYFHQHALTALSGVDLAANTVLHCHGRIDRPKSLIATETDYKKLYLDHVEGSQDAFLNSLDILFGSSPILFVGYSLADGDLLRPLELLRRQSPRSAESPPLFALVSQTPQSPRLYDCAFLLERYGVQVLPYDRTKAEGGPKGRGKALCRKLKKLKRDLSAHSEARVLKPGIRKVTVPERQDPREPYLHYAYAAQSDEDFRGQRVHDNLGDLKKSLDQNRVTLLVGPGGVGKSWHVLRLIDELYTAGNSGWTGFFFWSSYYAYDTLTGLERLAAYLDRPNGSTSGNALSRIRGKKEQPCLVVLDGFERLLLPGKDPEQGAVYDSQLREFLELFADDGCQLRLLITSRLRPELPEALENRQDQPQPIGTEPSDENLGKEPCVARGVNELTLRPIGSEAFYQNLGKRAYAAKDVSALYSLLGGHSYGLKLAAKTLKEDKGSLSRSRRLRDLLKRLREAAPHARLGVVIERAIEIANDKSGSLALPMLERLAMFMGPVGENVRSLCHGLARGPKGSEQGRVLNALEGMQLVFSTKAGDGSDASYVHPTVRNYIFREVQEAFRDSPPNFTLPGFTSGNAAVYPGSDKSILVIEELFDHIHDQAVDETNLSTKGHLCRSLFALVRSRMEANTASRWLSYGEYARLLLKLLNLAKHATPEARLWANCAEDQFEEIQYDKGFLYADELAWIYNDLGLAFCSEGQMEDTLDLWEQGFEINRLIEGGTGQTRFSLQSQLHLAHTHLELGALRLATDYLDETERTNSRVKDKDYEGRILGYRGLLTHLGGDLERAEGLYDEALGTLRLAGGNPRAESYFLRHRAALQINLGRPKDAKRYADSSLARAEAGEYPDMIAFARSTRGGVFRANDELPRALTEYDTALRDARLWGVRRLEAEILGEQARVYLALGDGSIALERAAESLKIANSLSMGLRQTSGLIYLGQAMSLLGRRRMALSYFQLAHKLGVKQGYLLKSRDAERELVSLGAATDEEAPWN